MTCRPLNPFVILLVNQIKYNNFTVLKKIKPWAYVI